MPKTRAELVASWRARNRERDDANTRAWRIRNRERTRAASRRYDEGHRQERATLAIVRVGRRRAIEFGAEVRVIRPRDVRRMLRAGCAYCSRPAKTLDHVIPLARGGRHAVGNLVGACRQCNASKRSRLLVEWRRLKV